MIGVDKKIVKWQLWYQDVFDEGCPRQIEEEGFDLIEGLIALWQHHLTESVSMDGSQTFSQYNLWLVDQAVTIDLNPLKPGILKIKKWFTRKRRVGSCFINDVNPTRLLNFLAKAHFSLWKAGLDESQILEAAESAKDIDEFMEALTELNSN